VKIELKGRILVERESGKSREGQGRLGRVMVRSEGLQRASGKLQERRRSCALEEKSFHQSRSSGERWSEKKKIASRPGAWRWARRGRGKGRARRCTGRHASTPSCPCPPACSGRRFVKARSLPEITSTRLPRPLHPPRLSFDSHSPSYSLSYPLPPASTSSEAHGNSRGPHNFPRWRRGSAAHLRSLTHL
jgi:hypothetical protein